MGQRPKGVGGLCHRSNPVGVCYHLGKLGVGGCPPICDSRGGATGLRSETLVVRGDRVLVPPARTVMHSPTHPLHSLGGPGDGAPPGGWPEHSSAGNGRRPPSPEAASGAGTQTASSPPALGLVSVPYWADTKSTDITILCICAGAPAEILSLCR